MVGPLGYVSSVVNFNECSRVTVKLSEPSDCTGQGKQPPVAASVVYVPVRQKSSISMSDEYELWFRYQNWYNQWLLKSEKRNNRQKKHTDLSSYKDV